MTVTFTEQDLQADSGTSGAELAEARSLVQRLGGLVWVEREPAGGTTLSCTLPVASRADG
jgi:signal transduction histidine kinase